jgi:hypothetical protein
MIPQLSHLFWVWLKALAVFEKTFVKTLTGINTIAIQLNATATDRIGIIIKAIDINIAC